MLFSGILLIQLTSGAFGVDNGLGLTPQMGWNSWNHYGCNINQEMVEQTALSVSQSGLQAAGYNYINVDDCWQIARNPEGIIVPDPARFPNFVGMIEYVHSLGLKFGLYSDAGNFTCQHRPGSLGYETIDANTYAAWKVDYLKYDNCYNDGISPLIRYPPMSNALNATGRHIFFSLCEWGKWDPATWAATLGNSWRTTTDISDVWKSVMWNANHNDKWWKFAGKGGWNDPDMLEVGNGGLSEDEEISHFSLWALMKAPLIVGCDVNNMTSTTKEILMNKAVIAVNQDPLGVQGHKLQRTNGIEFWAGPLSDGSQIIVVLNDGLRARNVTVPFKDVGLEPDTNVKIQDLWNPSNDGVYTNQYEIVNLRRHASVMLKAKVQE